MRYSRQELVIGRGNQKKLASKKVAIIGLGAIGSSLAEMAVRAGILNLTIIDRDIVELSNLQRQMLYTEDDIDKPKSIVARERLLAINKQAKINARFDNLDYTNVELIKADVVLDCSDNIETRMLVNDYCSKERIPWIYAAGVGQTGYVMPIIPGKTCFRCIFDGKKSNETCETNGVLASLTNIIASIQFNQALKILTGESVEQGLIKLDMDDNNISKLDISKDENCKSCNGDYEYLRGRRQEIISFCGSNRYMIASNVDIGEMRRKLAGLGRLVSYNDGFRFNNMIFLKNKIIIKARDEKEARNIYSKYVGA